MSSMKIEGVTVREILDWPEYYFDELVLLDDPIVVQIGSTEVLGQFSLKNQILVVELAQIDGGGEGVLRSISVVAQHIAKIKKAKRIDCIVYATNCAVPNLKLRAYLEKVGFEVKNIEQKGEAYFKEFAIAT